MSWRRHVLGFVATAVFVVGCADDGPVDEGTDTGRVEVTDVSERPDVAALVAEEADGDPPGTLQVRDVVEGEGDEAAPGTAVTVQYVGVAWSTGDEFDASWDRGQPFTFELGAGRVIEGWELGVEGMRAGGRRVLVIPPELAYDDAGVPGLIEPGETLVFVVDLLEVAPS